MAVDLIARALALKAGGGSGGSGFAKEADFNAPGFMPEENTYYIYKDSGVGPAIEYKPFVLNEEIPSSFTLHLDPNTRDELSNFIDTMEVDTMGYPFLLSKPNSSSMYGALAIGAEAASEDMPNGMRVLMYQCNDGGETMVIPLYSTFEVDLPMGSDKTIHFDKGWQNFDDSGNVILVSGGSDAIVGALNMSRPATLFDNLDWNGKIISWAEPQAGPKYQDGLLYFYDGETMNIVNGELNEEAVTDLVAPIEANNNDVLSVGISKRTYKCEEPISVNDTIENLYIPTALFDKNDLSKIRSKGQSKSYGYLGNYTPMIEMDVSVYNANNDTTIEYDYAVVISYAYLITVYKQKTSSSWSSDILYPAPQTYAYDKWANNSCFGKYAYPLYQLFGYNGADMNGKTITITVTSIQCQDIWGKWLGKSTDFVIDEQGENKIQYSGPNDGAYVLRGSGDTYRLILTNPDKYCPWLGNYESYTVYTGISKNNPDKYDKMFFNTSLSEDEMKDLLGTFCHYSDRSRGFKLSFYNYAKTECNLQLLIGKSQNSDNYALAFYSTSGGGSTFTPVYATAEASDYEFYNIGVAPNTFKKGWSITYKSLGQYAIVLSSSRLDYTPDQYGKLITIDDGVWYDGEKTVQAKWDRLYFSDITVTDDEKRILKAMAGVRNPDTYLDENSNNAIANSAVANKFNTMLVQRSRSGMDVQGLRDMLQWLSNRNAIIASFDFRTSTYLTFELPDGSTTDVSSFSIKNPVINQCGDGWFIRADYFTSGSSYTAFKSTPYYIFISNSSNGSAYISLLDNPSTASSGVTTGFTNTGFIELTYYASEEYNPNA